MRGVAAITVMIYHFSECKVLKSSPLAVDIFFMLSGFVIAHSYGSRLRNDMSFLEYLGKRFIRLYPMFIMGLFIGVPVLYLLQKSAYTNAPSSFIATGLMCNLVYLPAFNGFEVQNFGRSATSIGEIFPSNPPAWSLFFEVIASFAFLALFRFNRKVLYILLACSFAAISANAWLPAVLFHERSVDFFSGWSTKNFYGGFPRVLFGFTFGLLIYSLAADEKLKHVHDLIERRFKRPYFLYFLLILIFLFPASIFGLYPAFILAVAAPCAIYIGSVVPCADKFSLSTAKFLGWLSYPLYCLHYPIGRAVFLIADGAHISKSIAFVAAILVTLAATIILTKIFDEPIRAFATQKLSAFLKPAPLPYVTKVQA